MGDFMNIQQKNKSRERIYSFLVDYIEKNGFAPSIREICTGTNLKSTSNVRSYLEKLEDEGRIEMKRYSPRAIKLVGYEYRKVEESTNGNG